MRPPTYRKTLPWIRARTKQRQGALKELLRAYSGMTNPDCPQKVSQMEHLQEAANKDPPKCWVEATSFGTEQSQVKQTELSLTCPHRA